MKTLTLSGYTWSNGVAGSLIRAAISLFLAQIALAQPDPLLERARASVGIYAKALPDYLCQQVTTRYVSVTRGVQWRGVDLITAEVTYENGRESYRNIMLSGRPVRSWTQDLGGAWSAGELGTQLWDLFLPSTGARFTYRKEAVVQGRDAALYTFEVQGENSHWGLLIDDNLVFIAYQGTVWIEKASGHVLRLERNAWNVPVSVQLDIVRTSTDYDFIAIGLSQRFLPVHSEVFFCHRDTNRCNKNVIDFHDYRKYTAETTISFDK